MDYILLIIGFVLLIKGADYFVDGSSSVARLLKVPTIVIGLTVVAFGTSMPEFSVSVTAAMRGDNDLGVGVLCAGEPGSGKMVVAKERISFLYIYYGYSASVEFGFLGYKGFERRREVRPWKVGRNAVSCAVPDFPVCNCDGGSCGEGQAGSRRCG